MPQVVVAREDAMRCQRALREGGSLEATITIDVNSGGSYTAHNVIAEIPGTDLADEILIIGAHLDSWALGTGANDNGCNVSMMIDIARRARDDGETFKEAPYSTPVRRLDDVKAARQLDVRYEG